MKMYANLALTTVLYTVQYENGYLILYNLNMKKKCVRISSDKVLTKFKDQFLSNTKEIMTKANNCGKINNATNVSFPSQHQASCHMVTYVNAVVVSALQIEQAVKFT